MALDQDLLYQFFNVASEAILVADSTGTVQFVNPPCERLFGQPSSNLVGKPMIELTPDRIKAALPPLQQLFDFSQPRSLDVSYDGLAIVKPDGSEVPVKVRLSSLLGLGGPLLVATMADLSEFRRTEIELLKLSRTLENIPVSVMIFSRAGRIEYVNPAFVQISGYQPAELLGEHSALLRSNMNSPELYDEISAAIAQGRVWRGELSNRHKGGDGYWVLASFSPVLNEQGEITHSIYVAEDISERRKAAEELRQAKETAEAASRAKSEFLANMSHEIRTPMNAITGLTHLVLQTELNDVQSGYVNKIQSSAQGLLRVINDILDFSRVEAGKLIIEAVEFDLDQVIENLSVLISLKAQEKGIEILFSRAPTVPDSLVGDPSRLLQILTNLANNAIKFTEKGEVLILTELVGKVPKRGTGQLSGMERVILKFTVRDTGIGMTQEQVSRLFKPFSQADTSTSRKYGGSGLGLAISRQLVLLMGGEIQVESALNEGSTFSFTAEFGIRQKPAEENQLHGQLLFDLLRGLRVLVVDDNLNSRTILEQYLSFYTRQVTVSSSGLEAIAELERSWAHDPYGLLVIDQDMPGLDGGQVLRSLREKRRYANLPVILMLTTGEQEQRNTGPRAIDLADTVLYKPINPSRLYDALVDTLGPRSLAQAPLPHSRVRETEAKAGQPPFLNWDTNALSAEKPSHPPPVISALSNHTRPEDPVRHLHGARLLLVEDNMVNQEMTRRLLESAGFVVQTASSGKQALAMLDVMRVDGVLMDIHMPVMDGLETTRAIRSMDRFASLPVIALTANVFDDMRRRCMEAGMNAFVGKPVNLPELFATLKECIHPQAEAQEPGSNEEPAVRAPVGLSTSPAVVGPAPALREPDVAAGEGGLPDIKTQIVELGHYLEENDTRAGRVLAGLKVRVADAGVQADLVLLEKLISRYNYDSALKLLAVMAEKLQIDWKP